MDVTCNVEIDLIDSFSSEIINRENFTIKVDSLDYVISPFPLTPFPIDEMASFSRKTFNHLDF